MKRTLLLTTLFLACFNAFSQTPGVKWSRYIRTSNDGEAFYDMKITPDDGYIVVGTDSMANFNYQPYWLPVKYLHALAWIAKLDTAGNLVWRKDNRSNARNSAFTSVALSAGGGYVAAGYNGSVTDSANFYIVKYSADGTLIWEKNYGGSQKDYAYTIANTSSGGYIVGGFAESNDGDVSGNQSVGVNKSDVWLLKLDAGGNIIWKHCYGGTLSDTAYSVIQTPDKGFVVAGASSSSDGDMTTNNGLTDAWLFKTDSLGNLLWQKNFGGVSMDGFKSLVLNADGSYTITGYSSSSTATSNGNKGSTDLWVARISSDGNTVLWSKGFGGTADEMGISLVRTQDDGFFVGGYTRSTDVDVLGNNGLSDAWVIKVNATGNLVWQKCVGTNKDEAASSVVYQNEGVLTIAGVAQPVSVPEPSDGYIAKLGNTNLIKGILYLDNNLNGVKDVGEPPFNQAIVLASMGATGISCIPFNGGFQFDVGTGSYNTIPVLQLPYYTATPPSRASNFATYFNKDSFSFAIRPIANKQDLNIAVVPVVPARPGFNVAYKIYYKNAGTVIMPNVTILFAPDNRLSLVSAVPLNTSSSGDTLKWDLTNLQPLGSGVITLTMTVPLVPNGTLLSSLAIINPVTGDLTPNDDSAYMRQVVQGSHDPNDKEENLGGNITTQQVSSGGYINYFIRFQNTGNDTAFNITVRDTLDTQLNAGNIQMIAASHPYQLQITGLTMMAWTFNDINLPDSNTNESASHGFIAYRIKAKPSLVAGNIIKNNASIYFDFNVPEKTNMTQTLVGNNVTLPLRLLRFDANYQKPNADLEWSTASELNVQQFEIERGTSPLHFTTVGHVASSGNNNAVNYYNYKDDLKAIPGENFFYRLKMMDIDGHFTYSGVQLVKREGKSINEIQVGPNPVNGNKAMLYINFNNDAMAELRITDMQGRQIITGSQKINRGYNVVPIDLSSLKNGSYMLQLKAEGKQMVTKFILFR